MPGLSPLINILLFTFLATIISLLLVGTLLLHKTLVQRLSFPLVAFAAGALLATGFLDTLKEALKLGGDGVLLWVTIGIAAFFVIERFFLFFHHHEEVVEHPSSLRVPTGFLLFGDALHNFIDGASIASTFLVSFPLGVITSITVFIHEIPHELGDFGILLHKGWGRGRVLLFNLGTGFAAIAGALGAYFLGSVFAHVVPLLLAITTANFIYLSATGLLPEIHHHAKQTMALKLIGFFLGGMAFVIVLINLLEH